MKRWTAFITYKKTEDVDGTLSFDFDEVGELEAILERNFVSTFNLSADVQLRYNGHMGLPISQMQCIMEGDFENPHATVQ